MSEQSLNFARRGIRPVSKLIVLSTLSVALLVLDNRYSVVQEAKKLAATAIYPIQWLANQPVEWYEYGSAFVQSQSYLLSENQRLTAENTRQRMQIRQSDLQGRELASLKKLMSLQHQGVPATTAAEIISYGKGSLATRIIINKGSRDRVQTGDAVIDEGGLIGQVGQVHLLSAEVNLLTEGKMVVPVMVARTGVRSLVYGGGGEVSLRYFPTDADLQPNDLLLTSGLDSVYPAGIPVAKVKHTGRNAGTPYYTAVLQPSASLQSSKYVLVLPQSRAAVVHTASEAAALPHEGAK